MNVKIELCCSLLQHGIECLVLFPLFFIGCVHCSYAKVGNDPSTFVSP
jgi:hypothetical protein